MQYGGILYVNILENYYGHDLSRYVNVCFNYLTQLYLYFCYSLPLSVYINRSIKINQFKEFFWTLLIEHPRPWHACLLWTGCYKALQFHVHFYFYFNNSTHWAYPTLSTPLFLKLTWNRWQFSSILHVSSFISWEIFKLQISYNNYVLKIMKHYPPLWSFVPHGNQFWVLTIHFSSFV